MPMCESVGAAAQWLLIITLHQNNHTQKSDHTVVSTSLWYSLALAKYHPQASQWKIHNLGIEWDVE